MLASVDARQWSQSVLSEMSCCVYRVMRGGELSGFHMSRAAANRCAAVPRVAALSLSRAIRARYLVPGGFFGAPQAKKRFARKALSLKF